MKSPYKVLQEKYELEVEAKKKKKDPAEYANKWMDEIIASPTLPDFILKTRSAQRPPPADGRLMNRRLKELFGGDPDSVSRAFSQSLSVPEGEDIHSTFWRLFLVGSALGTQLQLTLGPTWRSQILNMSPLTVSDWAISSLMPNWGNSTRGNVSYTLEQDWNRWQKFYNDWKAARAAQIQHTSTHGVDLSNI